MSNLDSFLGVTLVAAVLAWCSTAAFAHHSAVEYDRSEVVEFEGETRRVSWRNPHILLEVATIADDGQEVVWELEGAAVSAQRRHGVTEGLIQVGDTVRVAGYASTRRPAHLLVEHVLLPDGVELLVGGSRVPRWSEDELGSADWVVDPERAAAAEADGIYRVWTRGQGVGPWYFRATDAYELTDWAAAQAAEWDPLEDNPQLDCTPPGMPGLMGNPYPMQFVQRDSDIELRFEEFDVVRRIHMGAVQDPENAPFSPLGYSVGRWQGDTLVVSTSRIDWPHFDRVGIPQSRAVRVEERFTLVEADDRLDYELTVTDPEVLLEPMIWQGHWEWRPGEAVGLYQCTVEG